MSEPWNTWPARSSARTLIVFGPAELVSSGSGTVHDAMPEPESEQTAWAICPNPYESFTVTVGSESSIGTATEPCEPSVPWKSSEWMSVPLTVSDVPGVNAASSRL